MLFIFSVIRIAIHNPILPFRFELSKGHVHRNARMPAELCEIRLTFGPLARLPGFNGSLCQRERVIGNGETVINCDGSAKTAAGRTRPDRIVETEERRRRSAVLK